MVRLRSGGGDAMGLFQSGILWDAAHSWWQSQIRALSTELSTVQCKTLSSMVTPQENEGQTTQIHSQFLLMGNDHLNCLKIQQRSLSCCLWHGGFAPCLARGHTHCTLLQDRRVMKNLSGGRTGREFPLAGQDVASSSGFAAHDKWECQALRAESQIRQADPQKMRAESENIFYS